MRYDSKEMARMYLSGMDQPSIARAFRCSQSMVSLCLKKEGVKCKRARNIEWDRDELRRLYHDQGLSHSEIAEKMGCRPQSVSKAMQKLGIPSRPPGPPRGPKHPSWKGGRYVDKYGYILIHTPDHPDANSAGYVREHRLVAEKVLGRRLTPQEVVHHKDGDRQNNTPDNLQVFDSNADHLRHELTGKCPKWTEDGRRRILEGVRKPRRKRASRRS